MTVVLFVGKPVYRLQMSRQIMQLQVITANIISLHVVKDLQIPAERNMEKQMFFGRHIVVVMPV